MQSASEQASKHRTVANSRSAVDALDHQLRRAEDAIQRRAWGVCAAVVLRCGIDEEGGGEWQQSLCFGKFDGCWRLHLESGFLDDPSSLKKADLFTASLETRLLAAKKIPLLIEALQALETREAEDPRSVAQDLGRFLDRFLRTEC